MALNSALGVTATLKYPASGDFLSPLLFGDWDGDGQDEAAVLYTLDASAGNVYLAILEPTEENGWRVTQTAEGLSSEVESVNTAHLRDENSLQILVGYASAQGDRYMVVYLYTEDGLQIIIKQAYTEMILANLTGGEGTQDLVLALPAEQEGGGLNLQLLTNTEDGFRSAQTLAIGDYSGCAALHAGIGDSFSALDYKTDVALRRALKAETGDATVIIVAQRISTVLHANQILVLEDGRIVGKGTHAQLMESCPAYQEIARSQLSNKELDLKGGEA